MFMTSVTSNSQQIVNLKTLPFAHVGLISSFLTPVDRRAVPVVCKHLNEAPQSLYYCAWQMKPRSKQLHALFLLNQQNPSLRIDALSLRIRSVCMQDQPDVVLDCIASFFSKNGIESLDN